MELTVGDVGDGLRDMLLRRAPLADVPSAIYSSPAMELIRTLEGAAFVHREATTYSEIYLPDECYGLMCSPARPHLLPLVLELSSSFDGARS
ncbi:hypothetical protein E2562_022025 [Oryza meyeriana var. granulata]|uniref:Uncharacterized protein n=1 Tax=Oryza meyeriana var. granulata TaxID=110450 RepID=A0A6G1ENH4_9ORYZ|nr:hypothetical protein E2562_022025 [Oryza meyeriana var. granulata]